MLGLCKFHHGMAEPGWAVSEADIRVRVKRQTIENR